MKQEEILKSFFSKIDYPVIKYLPNETIKILINKRKSLEENAVNILYIVNIAYKIFITGIVPPMKN